MTKVSLDISEKFYAFAKQQAALFGYIDTEDYLTGMLNTTLLSALLAFERNGPLRLSAEACDAEREFFAELEEDEGGGVRLKSDGKEGDLDDDIPF